MFGSKTHCIAAALILTAVAAVDTSILEIDASNGTASRARALTTARSLLAGHDGSKCTDIGQDCCASDSWGEPQTCSDGYLPVPTSVEDCVSTYLGCVTYQGGIGCYACVPPTSTCNVESWPGVELKCGEPCRALLRDMDNWGPYGGKCENFCAKQGLECVSQQEEADNGCRAEWTGSCEIAGKQNGENSGDLICTCAPWSASTKFPTTPSPTYEDARLNGHDGSKCSDHLGGDCCAHNSWGVSSNLPKTFFNKSPNFSFFYRNLKRVVMDILPFPHRLSTA